MNSNYIILGLLIVIAYISVYSIVHRICTCIEHCSTARSVAMCMNNGKTIDMDDLMKKLEKTAKSMGVNEHA